MTSLSHVLAVAIAAGALAAPGAAQYYPQQPYQPYQPYPNQYPPQQYPYPGYPQNQSVVGQIIDSLIGNRYNVTDRQAIHACGNAAIQRAQAQYGGYANPYGGPPRPGYDSEYPQSGGYNGQYPQAYQGNPGYNNSYNGYPGYMRVVAINDVERRSGGLKVHGLIDSGLYRNRMRTAGDLSFRCNVNYNGYVTSIRVERNPYR